MAQRTRLFVLNILLWGLGGLPLVLYLFVSNYYAVDVFFADDFHLFKNIVWIQEASTLSEKWALLFQQHNEHRIVFPRLLAYTNYLVEGRIHWPTLILAGNLLWCGIVWILWRMFKYLSINAWYFLPVPYLLFQPQYYDNLTWSISVLQQSVSVFWYGFLIWLLATKRPYWALALAVVATFTHGNGLFSFVVGILLLMFQQQYKKASLWFAVLLLTATLYFWDFRNGQNSNIGGSLANPLLLISSFWAFWGSLIACFSANAWACVGVGGLCFGLIAGWLLRVWKNKQINTPFNSMLLGFSLFVSITAGLVALSRSWAGIEAIIAPRYQHYSPLVLSISYLILLAWIHSPYRRYVLAFFVAFAFIFNGLSYWKYTPELEARRNSLLADAQNWRNHEVFLAYPKSLNNNFREVCQKAETRGIIHFGKTYTTGALPKIGTEVSITEFHTTEKDASGTFDRQYFIVENKTLAGIETLLLQDSTHTFWVGTVPNKNTKKGFLLSGKATGPGFKAFILTENLPKGNYTIALKTDRQVFLTDKTLSWQQ